MNNENLTEKSNPWNISPIIDCGTTIMPFGGYSGVGPNYTPSLEFVADPEDPAIESRLSLDSNKCYILTLSNSPYVADLTRYMLPALKERYGKPVEQISLTPIKPNSGQYVLINQELKDLMLGEYFGYGLLSVSAEEFNRQVSSSEYVSGLIGEILVNQPDLLVNPYLNTELELPGDDRLLVLAADGDLVGYFDNKINQRAVVDELSLPVPESFIASDIDDLGRLYKDNYPGKTAFVMCPYSRSGTGVEIVNSEEDIFNSQKIASSTGGYVLEEFINVELSPSTLGIIGRDGVCVVGISDQIMDGTHYMGNVSPSAASYGQKEQMIMNTELIGEYMKNKGYFGPFGVDFMVDDRGNVYFAEINPRVIGATPALTRASLVTNPGLPSIPETIYNAVASNTLGFDPGDYVIPEVAWGYRTIKAPIKDYEKRLISGQAGECVEAICCINGGVPIYNESPLGYLLNKDPHATREEILDTLNGRQPTLPLP